MVTLKPKKGVLLVAEPSIIGDVSFNRSVVLLAEHGVNGSVGFILNKPIEEITLKSLFPGVKNDFKLYNGGPVEQRNLYFIHSIPELISDSIEIASGIYWGGNFDTALKLINDGVITKDKLKFFLGYSGWSEDQLKDELDANSWLLANNTYQSSLINKTAKYFWKELIQNVGGDYLLWVNTPEDPSYN